MAEANTRGDAPVRLTNDVEEFCEVVHIFTPTLRGEHVLGEMEYVLPIAIVGVKESLSMASRTVERVRVRYSAVQASLDVLWYPVPWKKTSRFTTHLGLAHTHVGLNMKHYTHARTRYTYIHYIHTCNERPLKKMYQAT